MDKITDAEFDEKIKTGITLIDFYADWCGPCRQMTPILQDMSQSDGIKGVVTFYKLDVDKNPLMTKKFDITSIPTVIVFKDGQLRQRFVGSVGGLAILNDLKKILA